MNLFAGCQSWVRAASNCVNGVAVTYRRGALSCPLTAGKGSTDFVSQTDQGLAVAQMRSPSHLIAVSELILDGQPATPKQGDEIDEVIGDWKVTFTVGRDSGPAFTYSDNGRTQFRVYATESGKCRV